MSGLSTLERAHRVSIKPRDTAAVMPAEQRQGTRPSSGSMPSRAPRPRPRSMTSYGPAGTGNREPGTGSKLRAHGRARGDRRAPGPAPSTWPWSSTWASPGKRWPSARGTRPLDARRAAPGHTAQLRLDALTSTATTAALDDVLRLSGNREPGTGNRLEAPSPR